MIKITLKILEIEHLLSLKNLEEVIAEINKDELLTALRFFTGIEEFDESKYDSILAILHKAPHILTLSALLAAKRGRSTINTFATRTSKILTYILSRHIDDQGLQLVAKHLGIRIEYSSKCLHEHPIYIDDKGNILRICYHYRVRISDFLKAAHSLLTEPPWKLTAHPIIKGYIYIESKESMARLLAEHYRFLLAETLNTLRESAISDIEQILQSLPNDLIESIVPIEYRSTIQSTTSENLRAEHNTISDTSLREDEMIIHNLVLDKPEAIIELAKSAFPPCIKAILEALLAGENLSHHQRFALASFLINIGAEIDAILELFRRSPDFNERIARYQIEHIAGLRGSRKRYLPYSCATMNSLGLCIANCGVKNPLVYFYKRIRMQKSKRKVRSRSSLQGDTEHDHQHS